MSTCSGRGECLQQADFNQHIWVPSFDCSFHCKPIPCPNFILCGRSFPQVYLDCWSGRCLECDMTFGYPNLTFIDHADCPICLETQQSVAFPGCGHPVCVQCFRRMFDGPARVGEPPFPYPLLEDIYYDNQEWFHENDPELCAWNDAWNAWDDACGDAYAAEEHNRKCPLCRHEHIPVWKKTG